MKIWHRVVFSFGSICIFWLAMFGLGISDRLSVGESFCMATHYLLSLIVVFSLWFIIMSSMAGLIGLLIIAVEWLLLHTGLDGKFDHRKS